MDRSEWISPAELEDMLITNPRGAPCKEFSYAILKKELRGCRNSAAAFAKGKLQPQKPGQAATKEAEPLWAKTAADWMVVLAPGVADDYKSPELLFSRFDAEVSERARSLLVSTTIKYEDATNRHEAMLDGIMFAAWLARTRSLSSLLVQHIPALAGSSNPMHIHLLTITGARHTPLCFGPPDPDFLTDGGQDVMFREWTQLKHSWG